MNIRSTEKRNVNKVCTVITCVNISYIDFSRPPVTLSVLKYNMISELSLVQIFYCKNDL